MDYTSRRLQCFACFLDGSLVSWMDLGLIGVDVMEITFLGWGSERALDPLVVLVPQTGGDMVLVVNLTSAMSQMTK